MASFLFLGQVSPSLLRLSIISALVVLILKFCAEHQVFVYCFIGEMRGTLPLVIRSFRPWGEFANELGIGPATFVLGVGGAGLGWWCGPELVEVRFIPGRVA